jgi:hypothetical protein
MTGFSKFSFLRRVRIHDGECGAVARALHHTAKSFSLPAAMEKVFLATNERKVMSKKTFFKRIAISAIAALGLGMLSVVPSQAAVTSHTLTIDSATDTADVNDTATAVLTHSFVNLGSFEDSVTITGVVTSSNSAYAGTLSITVTDSYTSTANDASSANSPEYRYGQDTTGSATQAFAASNGWASTRDSVTIAPGATGTRSQGSVLTVRLYNIQRAGTYTVSFFTQTSDGGVAPTSSTVGVTWTVTATAPSATSTTASTVTLRNGSAAVGGTYFSGTAEGTDSQTLAARSTSTITTTPGFSLIVKQKNGLATNTAAESYTVTVSGEAWVTAGTNPDTGLFADATVRPTSSTGVKFLRMATPVADSATVVRVWSTGTAGTATITVTADSGAVLGTKTVTFHGPVTAIAVSRDIKKFLQAGISTDISSVFNVTATDAGGRNVTGQSISIVSSNVSAIGSGSCVDASGAVTDGVHVCSVTPIVTSTSGMTATLTARVVDPAGDGTTYLTTTYGVTMGGAVSTVVLTTDKATYEPGGAMIVTATAKDSSGNTPYDGQSGPTIRANKALGGSGAAGSTITMNDYYDGVSTSKTRSTPVRTILASDTLFAPAASGKFTITGLDGQTVPVAISVTATVSDDGATAAANAASDAALEAIDAANAATDAANLAAEAADAATVAAEEARDAADAATAAVEALATEVATLMAALKAQITTLANTVAKIAKKVKA